MKVRGALLYAYDDRVTGGRRPVSRLERVVGALLTVGVVVALAVWIAVTR